MYNGTIKKTEKYSIKFRNKEQMLQIEQIERNGVVTEQYKIKTVEFKNDKNIKVRDFDIKNLMAIGVINTLKPTTLQTPTEKVQANAETANIIMEQIDFIKSIENEQQQTQD